MTKDHDVQRVDITPDLAREWLGYNTHNRRLRAGTVSQYASDMRSGDWQWNGESIKFSKDGTLLDGQHRLAAILEAEATIPMLVVRGLSNETQDTVDGGIKRKFSDVLQLHGEPMYMSVAAIVRKAAIWEAGGRKSLGNGAGGQPITNAVLVKFLEKNPDIRDAARLANNANPRCFLPVSICGLGYWLFSRIDPDDAEHFFTRLHDGQNMAKGDPIYELRRVMETTKSMRGERSTTFITAVMIKAWNAFRDGRTVMVLTFRPGGAKPEQFPEPH